MELSYGVCMVAVSITAAALDPESSEWATSGYNSTSSLTLNTDKNSKLVRNLHPKNLHTEISQKPENIN